MGLSIETAGSTASQAGGQASSGNWGQAVSAGSGLIGGLVGMIGQKKRNERAFRQQKELMGIQQQNQMGLNQQGKDLALQQWHDTNYEAQKEHMENAGLNVGLMYGMSGGSGTTANTGSGGNAQGGNAPSQAPMDIQSALSSAMLMSQMKLMEAQTEKTKAEATKISGVDTELASVQRDTQKGTMKSIVDKAFYDAVTASNISSKSGSEAGLASETYEAQRTKIENEAVISSLEIGLKKIGIEKTQAEIVNMAEQIKIGKFNANINAQQMGLDKVAGTQLMELIDEIYKQTGQDKHKTPQIK